MSFCFLIAVLGQKMTREFQEVFDPIPFVTALTKPLCHLRGGSRMMNLAHENGLKTSKDHVCPPQHSRFGTFNIQFDDVGRGILNSKFIESYRFHFKSLIGYDRGDGSK